MPEDSISKRFAAKLRISGRAKTSNLPNKSNTGDLIDRPSSIEQKAELSRADNANRLPRPSIDNIQFKRSTKEGNAAVAERNGDSVNSREGIKDYSLPPISYARSQIADSPEDSTEKSSDPNRSLGIKENKDLQHANIYRPESMNNNSASATAYADNSGTPTISNTSPNSSTPNAANQPVLSPTDNMDMNSNNQTTSGQPRGNPAQKAVTEATKKAIKGLAKKIAANPAAWPWIIGGLAILLALIILASFIGFHYMRRAQVPNPDGKSLPVQVDPIADKEWVKKVLMLSGDKDVANVLKEESATLLKNNLETIKTLIQSDTTIPATDKTAYIANINNIILKVDEVTNASNEKTKAQKVSELKNAINEFIRSLALVSPLPSTLQTRTPLKEAVTRFNTHPHLGSFGWPSTETPKGYLSPARTYLQTGEGTCDAVDLKVGGNIDVYAVFAGKIVRQGGAWGVENEQNKAIAIYGHIDLNSGYEIGKELREGELFGRTQAGEGKDHLHFELAINNGAGWKCVTNSKEEVVSQQMAGWPEHQVGKSLWEKILTVLHSPSTP